MTKELLAGVVNPTDPDKEAAAEAAKRKYTRVAMLCGDNWGRYGNLVEELQKYFTKGNENYPADTTEALNLLATYKTSYNPPTILVDEL